MFGDVPRLGGSSGSSTTPGKIRRVATYVTGGTAGGNTPADTAGVWVEYTGTGSLVIPAVVGNYLEVKVAFLVNPSTSTFWDVAVKNTTLVWFGANGTGTGATEGDPALYPALYPYGHFAGLTVAGGHVSGGNVTFVMASKSNGTGKIYYEPNYPFRWSVINFGTPL